MSDATSPALEVGRVVPNAPSGLPQRKRLFHTTPPWIGSGEIFFITICSRPPGLNQLATPTIFAAMTTALEHYIAHQKLWCHLFVAMPDHVHALLSFPAAERMDTVIRNWKRFLTRSAGITWQDGFFDHRLRNDENFEEKTHYIRMNPVRAGLASVPEAWPYIWPAAAPATAR